jgi:hypothetical protein
MLFLKGVNLKKSGIHLGCMLKIHFISSNSLCFTYFKVTLQTSFLHKAAQ